LVVARGPHFSDTSAREQPQAFDSRALSHYTGPTQLRRRAMLMALYDISVTTSSSMAIWPGDPPVVIEQAATIAENGYAVSRLSFGSHTGTHLDAPRHMIAGGLSADRVPLETLIGTALVFEVEPEDGVAIHASDLVALGIPRDTTRLLLKTRNSDLWDTGPQTFEQHYVALTKRAAYWIADRGVKLLGFDYLSVDPYVSDDAPAHHELLSAGVVILEGLNLSAVTAGVYQLVALPLKTAAADGAPVRAVLIR
jgi:arylformamidase